ncbi:glycerophosphodiester phosphodiesterase family protein [Marinoscillum pacificum]|uniref:glycerophosphodiester phosphodiesterase family protein n=1 Tax=Marinoscillum pacificum TaxID=392723 RepID=UPI0021587A85|nr:glycerophosphodiester phosphodiesterase family protein [Marinoscillum pacificum]
MRYFFIILTIIFMSCNPEKKESNFDLQGHRGCRGLYPENTIPAFLHAIDLGVNTLEMDLAVTDDRELLVSHEPYMSAEMCLDKQGREISDTAQYQYNIYQMNYEEIQQFDCGTKPHPRFPEQKKMVVNKPLLKDVIASVNEHLKESGKKHINYNIEIKSQEKSDDVYHPSPADFSDLVYSTIDDLIDWKYVTIQSFDFRVLQYFHDKYPKVTLALLIENELPYEQNLDSLGFKPEIYSCYFKLLTAQTVHDLQDQEIKVIPWTVNEEEDMLHMIEIGVDGLITDYPDRFNL